MYVNIPHIHFLYKTVYLSYMTSPSLRHFESIHFKYNSKIMTNWSNYRTRLIKNKLESGCGKEVGVVYMRGCVKKWVKAQAQNACIFKTHVSIDRFPTQATHIWIFNYAIKDLLYYWRCLFSIPSRLEGGGLNVQAATPNACTAVSF